MSRFAEYTHTHSRSRMLLITITHRTTASHNHDRLLYPTILLRYTLCLRLYPSEKQELTKTRIFDTDLILSCCTDVHGASDVSRLVGRFRPAGVQDHGPTLRQGPEPGRSNLAVLRSRLRQTCPFDVQRQIFETVADRVDSSALDRIQHYSVGQQGQFPGWWARLFIARNT